MECVTFPADGRKEYKYVVVFSRYEGKLLLSRHRQRSTWETQGGHIEPGETPEQAARRFTLTQVCGYWAGDEAGGAAGVVFAADIQELGDLPPSEMEEVGLFDSLPASLTYPAITPVLWQRARAAFRL